MDEQRAWLKARRKRRLRILAVVLSVCVLFTAYPDILATLSVFASVEPAQSEVRYISGFTALSDEIREQTVPVGTELTELSFPDTLEAVVTKQPSEDTDVQTEDDGEEDSGENDGKKTDGDTTGMEDKDSSTGETEEGEPSDSEQENTEENNDTDAGEETGEEQDTQPEKDGESEETDGKAAAGNEETADTEEEENTEESAPAKEQQESAVSQETHTVTMQEYHAENVISVQTLENTQTEKQEETVTIDGVTWQSEPEYDGSAEGIYIFTAVLPDGYTLAEDVSLPQIHVTVEQADAKPRRAAVRVATASDWGGTGLQEVAVYDNDKKIYGAGNNLTITQGSAADTTKLYYTGSSEPIDLSPAEGSIEDGFSVGEYVMDMTGYTALDYSSLDIIIYMEGGALNQIRVSTRDSQSPLKPKSCQFFMSGGTLLTEEDWQYAAYANLVDISDDSVIKGKLNGYVDILVSGSPQIGGEGKGICIASGNKFTVKGALSNASIYVNPQANFADGTQIAQAASGYTITENDLAQMTLTGSYVEGKELYLENNAIYIRVKPKVPHTVTYNYNANGGTSATKTSDTVFEGAAVDLTPTATKDGWEFVGWNTEQDSHEGLTALTMGEADITLYAIYKKTLTASFYSGSAGAKETVSTTIYNNTTAGTVTAPAMKAWAVAAESGYTAWHWSSGKFSGKIVNPGSTVSLSSSDGDRSYYGLYQKSITVSYDANDGIGSAASQTTTRLASMHEQVAYQTSPGVTLHDGTGFRRDGYTFNGWIAGSKTGTNLVAAGTSVRPTQDITYYTISDIRENKTVTVEGVTKKPGEKPADGGNKGDAPEPEPGNPASKPDNQTLENPAPKPPVTPPAKPTSPTPAPGETPPAGKQPEGRPGTTLGQKENAGPETAGEPKEEPGTKGTDPGTPEIGRVDAQTRTADGTGSGQTTGISIQQEKVKFGDGTVLVTVVCEETKCTAAVADAEAVAEAVLTPDQQELVHGGGTIEIRIDVTDISGKVPAQDKEVIESGIEAYREEVPGLVLGMYVDISMFIKIGAGDWNAVNETDKPIEVVVNIPEKLLSDGREFYIIRAHSGEYAFMNDLDDVPDTITVSTDMFSSYAIAYVETEGAGADSGAKCGLCHICPTFLGICYFIWLAIIIAVVVIVILLVLRRKRGNKF